MPVVCLCAILFVFIVRYAPSRKMFVFSTFSADIYVSAYELEACMPLFYRAVCIAGRNFTVLVVHCTCPGVRIASLLEEYRVGGLWRDRGEPGPDQPDQDLAQARSTNPQSLRDRCSYGWLVAVVTKTTPCRDHCSPRALGVKTTATGYQGHRWPGPPEA
jgi:hypothetical protein